MNKLKQKAKKLNNDIPAIFLALKDKETSSIAKIFAALTVAYALSPVDLVPDFIPILGYLDDMVILPLLVTLTLKFISKEKMEECRIKAKGMWDNGKPKRWYYAVPVILFYAVIILVVISKFVK